MEKGLSIIRNRKLTDDLHDLDVNTALWDMFISVNHTSSCSSSWTRSFSKPTIHQESIFKVCEAFFRTTEKLIKDQTEIASLSTIDYEIQTFGWAGGQVGRTAFGHPNLAEIGQFCLTEFGQTAFGGVG